MSDNEESSNSDPTSDSDSSDRSEDELFVCVKLKLPENIRAYLENTELLRDEQAVPCQSKLAEEVVTNYIIAKKILSNICWQQKLLFKKVCTTWLSAVNALARERLNPIDFVFHISRNPKLGRYGTFTESDHLYNEPMAAFVFVNTHGLVGVLKCTGMNPPLCKPCCERTSHSVLDAIQQQVCAPKNCMLTVKASSLTYLPLANSGTELLAPDFPHVLGASFFCGISIPLIPGVKFHVLNIKQTKKTQNSMDLKKYFYAEVDKITQDQTIKGALVFVTEKYILDLSPDILLLNYLKEVQPDVPYALGGCLIEETVNDEKDIDLLIDSINNNKDFVTKTLISVALFTVPKTGDNSEHREKCNFEMFSVVIPSSDWIKDKIKKPIDEFAKSVPRFEHSVAFKLSCVGRDKKHLLEQELFRSAFPSTPIIGCYGNGEIGLNHPPRAPPAYPHSRLKRHKGESSLMYSYSTVFVYMGWGKIASADQSPKK